MNDQDRRDGFEFAPTRRSLPMALLMARESVMERFRPMLNAHGVTEQQWRVLRALQESENANASTLAEAACVLSPSLTRILKSLEARGFIKTRRHPDDGRRAQIWLTEQGQRFIADVSPGSARIYAGIEERISVQRIETLLDELEYLQSALDDQIKSSSKK